MLHRRIWTLNWKKDWKKQPPEVFYENGVLKNFVKFTWKHLCRSLKPATLLKKRLRLSYFPVNFTKFLRTPFLQNTSRRLLLWIWENAEHKKLRIQTFFRSEICLRDIKFCFISCQNCVSYPKLPTASFEKLWEKLWEVEIFIMLWLPRFP